MPGLSTGVLPPRTPSKGWRLVLVRRAVVAAATVLGLLLAAGGQSEPPALAPDRATDPDYSPFYDYMGVPDRATDQATKAAKWDDVEAAVAQCMADLGFNYIPLEVPSSAEDESTAKSVQGTIEYARQYGFGITTLSEPGSVAVQPAPGQQGAQVVVAGGEDPNSVALENKSDTEREAFYAALYGTVEGGISGGEGLVQVGCRQRAEQSVRGSTVEIPSAPTDPC